jgi:hypothetical protein
MFQFQYRPTLSPTPGGSGGGSKLCINENNNRLLSLIQREEELKKAALERRRDKEETQAARERVKAQIEQDRVDRAVRYLRAATLEMKGG